MTALITLQRFNWMGYNGTESEEIDTQHLRNSDKPSDNYSYAHRMQAILEMKERLYLIKRDLDLIPEEQLRAEEAERERKRAERKRREEEERLRKEAEEAARSEEAERKRQEEAEAQLEAERRRRMGNSEEEEERLNAILASIPRTQTEINAAAEGFTKGTRMLLFSTDNGYVSYLDGSVHLSAPQTEEYNTSIRERVIKALDGTNVLVPAAEEYSLAEVHAANNARDEARKKLDAFRVTQDPTYSSRIRSTEKDAAGNPMQQLAPGESDEPTLVSNYESTKKRAESVRKAYNAKAASTGNSIASALCSHSNSAY
ncbi:hypothetical protein JKF63_05826 [Porcisia hertigi]|uniref:Uncharacterized protein n=1 Tax=Porcisia hertigi TaxID=2761500 RepID=A0A836LFZ3_9TRYP|nr:hypothetical protein JKF63_05826 [Porcisia hertigi]